jgi:hypothetical protein
MCPSTIRELKVIVYFRKVFLLSKFKLICFVTILSISLKSRSCKNDHILFNVGISILEARPPIEDPMKGDTFDLRNNSWIISILIGHIRYCLTIRELYTHGIWWLFHLPPSKILNWFWIICIWTRYSKTKIWMLTWKTYLLCIFQHRFDWTIPA